MSKLISVISTCYNEESNITSCYEIIKELFKQNGYNYEHIFVDNFSQDNSKKIIRDICKKDSNVKAIFNSKNYGPFLSNFNGLKYATGDYIIVNFASDIQDPPEIINKFLGKMEEGFDVVYGIKDTTDENVFFKKTRRIFYYLIDKFSTSNNPRNANEFMCVSKRILDKIINHKDYFPYIRGYFGKISDNISFIHFNRNKRISGKSKNSYFDLYTQAINAIISTMDKPIKCLSFFSLLTIAISGMLMIYSLISKIVFPLTAPKGITFLILIILFFFSLIILILSLMLEYLIAIHEQVRFNLEVSVDEKINF